MDLVMDLDLVVAVRLRLATHCFAGPARAVWQIAVSPFRSDLYLVIFVPNNNRVSYYRWPIRSGLAPDGCVLAYYYVGVPTPFPSAFP